MRKLIISACTIALVSLFSTSTNAQVVITEYVKMGDEVELNINTKAVEAALVANKGIRDLEWNNDTHILAITLDPRKTSVEDVLKKLAEITNNEAVASKVTPRRETKMTTVASKMVP